MMKNQRWLNHCNNLVKINTIQDEEDAADLDKYDLTADAELASFKVNLEALRKKMQSEGKDIDGNPIEGANKGPGSVASSE